LRSFAPDALREPWGDSTARYGRSEYLGLRRLWAELALDAAGDDGLDAGGTNRRSEASRDELACQAPDGTTHHHWGRGRYGGRDWGEALWLDSLGRWALDALCCGRCYPTIRDRRGKPLRPWLVGEPDVAPDATSDSWGNPTIGYRRAELLGSWNTEPDGTGLDATDNRRPNATVGDGWGEYLGQGNAEAYLAGGAACDSWGNSAVGDGRCEPLRFGDTQADPTLDATNDDWRNNGSRSAYRRPEYLGMRTLEGDRAPGALDRDRHGAGDRGDNQGDEDARGDSPNRPLWGGSTDRQGHSLVPAVGVGDDACSHSDIYEEVDVIHADRGGGVARC
jgi:hypothetical protein